MGDVRKCSRRPHASIIFMLVLYSISTTMGLKSPLTIFHSQWPFQVAIRNQFKTIFGKGCHIWNIALLSLLRYPLKKFHSQWPFQMAIRNQFKTIFGKDCHIWNTALLPLLRGSFQDENSIPSCKKFHSPPYSLKNLYIPTNNVTSTSRFLFIRVLSYQKATHCILKIE